MSVTEIRSRSHHDNFTSGNQRAVVFFGSKGCGHCKRMVPVINDMSKNNPHIKFAHVETSEIETEGLDGSVPKFVGYKEGEPVRVVRGADVPDLQKLLREISDTSVKQH